MDQTKTNSRNPFENRRAVVIPTRFFGRRKQITEIIRAINSEIPQDLQLVGERRIGKTSLINYLFDRNGGLKTYEKMMVTHKPEDLLVIKLDLTFLKPNKYEDEQNYTTQARLTFANTFFLRLHTAAKEFFAQNADLTATLNSIYENRVKDNPGLIMSADVWSYIDAIIKVKNILIVIVLDEADYLLASSAGPLLRPLSLEFSNNLCYILITRVVYAELEGAKEILSPFAAQLMPIFISLLSPEESRDMIVSKAEETGRQFTDHELDFILSVGGRHPDFLNVAAYHVFENVDGISEGELIKNISESLKPIMAVLLHSLSRLEGGRNLQKAMLQIAKGRFIEKFPEDEDDLKILEKRGFITIDKERNPQVFSSIFKDYIIREQNQIIQEIVGTDGEPTEDNAEMMYPPIVFKERQAILRNRSVELTKLEIAILKYLYEQQRVCTRSELYQNAWGKPYSEDNYSAMGSAINRLNHKLRENYLYLIISTERSSGYYLEFGKTS